MKKRRRIEQCPNCKEQLRITDNFCPKCGQENHVRTFSLMELWHDFIGSLFNFDGKILNTLKMIFTRPGKVPRDIIEGKKVRYVPTLRFYFFVSFIYFLILNFGVDLLMKSDDARFVLSNIFSDRMERTIPIDKQTYHLYKDSSQVALHTLAYHITDTSDIKFINKNELLLWKRNNMYDSIFLNKINDPFLDERNYDFGVVKFNSSSKLTKAYSIVFAMKPAYDSVYVNPNKISYKDLKELYEDREKIDDYVSSVEVDSNILQHALNKSITRLMAVIKFGNLTEKRNYIKNLLKQNLSNFSLALLLIMPLSALILYLFYYNKRPKLVPHILFTIHLHSVMLILLSLIFAGITSQYVFGFMLNTIVKNLLNIAILMYSLVYFIFAIKRFYDSSWRSAIFKSLIINTLYLVLLYAIAVAVFVISMI